MKIKTLVKKGLIPNDHWLTKAVIKREDVEIVDGIVVWKRGIWMDGIWKDGVWKSGTWKSGTWEGGIWKSGTWEWGIWKCGYWASGRWERGIWEDGIWKGGTWESGKQIPKSIKDEEKCSMKKIKLYAVTFHGSSQYLVHATSPERALIPMEKRLEGRTFDGDLDDDIVVYECIHKPINHDDLKRILEDYNKPWGEILL